MLEIRDRAIVTATTACLAGAYYKLTTCIGGLSMNAVITQLGALCISNIVKTTLR